jgi:hypothetical protein
LVDVKLGSSTFATLLDCKPERHHPIRMICGVIDGPVRPDLVIRL